MNPRYSTNFSVNISLSPINFPSEWCKTLTRVTKIYSSKSSSWTVVVAQLVERLFQTPEVPSLNPVIGKILD